MHSRFISDNISSSGSRLLFAGQDTVRLAEKYGTPLYLMDEAKIREQCRTYQSAMHAAFGSRYRVAYASKAAAFAHMARIMKEENMYLDTVSIGEIATAQKAGFPSERIYFHSNNKTDDDILYGLRSKVGYWVVDCLEELESLNRLAALENVRPDILLRLTPGIDPHTFAAVATGKVDSKFGFGIETGYAWEATKRALQCENVRLLGFHCHVGSQVFESDVFISSAKIMLDFIAKVKDAFGFSTQQLDLGGGFGVRYLPTDPRPDLEQYIREIGRYIPKECAALGIEQPVILLEPGRSIVAEAGMTLYTVGMVKNIPGLINYVSVDGGMADNIRYALYSAPYTVLPATRMDEPFTGHYTVVGRCCESGDIIQPNVSLPETVRRGDLIAVCTTGAYNYSMASNYNRLPRPPIVMLKNGESFVAVRGETLEDLLRLDV